MSAEPVHDTYRQDLPDVAADGRRPPERCGSGSPCAATRWPRSTTCWTGWAGRSPSATPRSPPCAPGPTASPGGRAPPHRLSTTTDRRMSIRLEVATEVRAPVTRVWDELVDWAGQSRWIPFTTVRITTAHDDRRWAYGPRPCPASGSAGCRSDCSTGSWSPAGRRRRPDGPDGAELEVLHLGPYFTGVGVFALRGQANRHPRDLRSSCSTCRAAGCSTRRVGCCCRCCAAGSGSACGGSRPSASRDRRRPAGPRRPAALPLGARRAGVPRLPRLRVGRAGHQRGRTVRAAEPGGLPVRPVLDHHPAQAGGLPGGLRRLRPANGSPRSTRPTSPG